MNKPKTTPKDFFLWAGAMIALYVSVFSLISLFFDYIDYAFPDTLNAYIDPYGGNIRYQIASLVVLFPLFLVLMYFIRRDIARDATRKDIWVRRWALVLTIFVAGATMAIDLIALINTYLGGEITTQFVFKVLIVFLVMGGGFLHFLADLRGYWDMNPRYGRSIAIASAILIVCTIGAGFFIVGSPTQIRLYRFDDQKVSDLMGIQSQIVSYWQTKQKLPASLSDLTDSLSGYAVPTDEQTGAPYSYTVSGKTSFQLCANFNAATQPNSPTLTQTQPMMPSPAGAIGPDLQTDSWYHGTGNVCFSRTIDPARYPPIKTLQ